MKPYIDRNEVRRLVADVESASLSQRPLDQKIALILRDSWIGLKRHPDLVVARDTFWQSLYRYYTSGYPMQKLADLSGISIGSFSNNFSARGLECFSPNRRTDFAGPPARKYEVNPNALDDLSCPVTAYILGFVWADGSIMAGKVPNSYIGLRVVLQIGDRDQLKMIADHLGSTAPIEEFQSSTQRNGRSHRQCGLSIYSTELADRFVEYGYASRDGGRANAAPPSHIMHDEISWWRGMIDGDGSIRRDPRYKNLLSGWLLELAATEATLQLFHEFLRRHIPEAKVDIRRNGHSQYNFRLSISGPSAVQAICLLYPQGCIGLKRKSDRASWIRKAAERAREFGIYIGEVGGRRQWIGSAEAKATLSEELAATPPP